MPSDYEKARRIGRRQVSAALSQGRYPYAPALDDMIGDHGGAGEVSLGTMEIPLDLVVGTRTRGRQNVFSEGFMPLLDPETEFALKWASLCQSQVEEGMRDPIVAYEYLQRFYVQEGNKRVSVARYLGMAGVPAHVTRVLPAPSQSDEYRLYQEYLRLWKVCPLWRVSFTRLGSCARLAKLLGQSLDEPWPDDVVHAVRATYVLFVGLFERQRGLLRDVSAADAFLAYVQDYGGREALGVGKRELASRIAVMQGELAVLAHEQPIAYADDMPEARGTTRIGSSVTRAIGGIKVPRLAFVYDMDPRDSGWIAQHERGRVAMQDRLGASVRTKAYYQRDNDQSFLQAVDEALADGADLIVTASPRQFRQTVRASMLHPRTEFANCSINLPSDRVRTFYARMYEVKFVLGALAAAFAHDHRVGYLAPSPIFGAVSEVNAFALGAAMVDPYATVHLWWQSTQEGDWLETMRGEGIRVAVGPDYRSPAAEGQPYGLCRIGTDGSVERLATPVWDWCRCYELVVRSLHDGSWKRDGQVREHRARNYWLGLDSGVVRLDLAKGLPEGQRRLASLLCRALRSGEVTPFDGALFDQQGSSIRDEGQGPLSDEEIATMSWLAPNVVGRLPKMSELSAGGLRAVEAAGIIGDEPDGEN